MSTAHTATPYQLTGDGLHLVGGNPQFLVADFDVNEDGDGNRARAKAAMLACNARDDLVTELEENLSIFTALHVIAKAINTKMSDDINKRLVAINAALTKAQGCIND